MCITVESVLDVTWKRAREEEQLKQLEVLEICKTAYFRFKMHTNYVLHRKVVCHTVCTRLEARTERRVVKVLETIAIDLNQLE